MRRPTSPTIYFKVTPGSEAMKAIERLIEKKNTQNAAIRKLRKELGLPKELHAFGSDRSVWGFSSTPSQFAYEYAEKHATAWRWDRKHHYLAPRRTTPEGKAIYAKIDALPRGTDGDATNRELFGIGMFFHDMSIVSAGWYWKKGGPAVLCVPACIIEAARTKKVKNMDGARKPFNAVPKLPKGLVEIKTSTAVKLMGKDADDAEAA